MTDDGEFPITIDYVKLPEIRPEDTVIVADPMLATGSTMRRADHVLDEADAFEDLFVLSAVSAPEGLVRVSESVPEADLLTVAIDDRLDDDGFILPPDSATPATARSGRFEVAAAATSPLPPTYF